MLNLLLWFSLLLSVCSGQLTPESVAEELCNANIEDYIADNLNETWYNTPRYYYVPMATEYHYRLAAETLLGRPVNSEEELAMMKLTCKRVPPKFIFIGYNPEKRVYQKCIPINKLASQMKCTRTMKCNTPPGTPMKQYQVRSIVYTDNKYLLVEVTCTDGKYQAFSVHSVLPTIKPKIERMIKKKMTEMGFNPKYFTYQTYD